MPKVRDILCQCGQFICQRQGDELIYHSLRLKLRETHDIECPACKRPIRFFVDNRNKVTRMKVNYS